MPDDEFLLLYDGVHYTSLDATVAEAAMHWKRLDQSKPTSRSSPNLPSDQSFSFPSPLRPFRV